MLIEGADGYLYGTASLYGGSNKRGTDGGSIVRLSPALKRSSSSPAVMRGR